MKGPLAKIFGVILIFTALIGILFSGVGIAYTWQLKNSLTTSLQADLDLMSNALTTTSEGLVISAQSLQNSATSIESMQTTVIQTSEAIEATTPMVETLISLLDQDLPNTVSSAQTSLLAAKESAAIIDSVMSALASIPFVGQGIYDPSRPLAVSLQEVSDSLDPIPADLETMKVSLEASTANLQTVQIELRLMSEDLGEISDNILEGQQVIEEYQTLTTDLQSRVIRARDALPGRLNSIALVVTYVLLWAGLSQIGLLIEGIDLLKRD